MCAPAHGAVMMLPSDLRQFQTELAGRLVLLDQPGMEIKALRERYGFTQEWLSTLVGLRRESLSRIEGGRVTLTLPFVQRFTRIVTLARAVREHLAYAEARGNLPDQGHLDTLAMGLRLDKPSADEIVLASMMAYEAKRKETLRTIPRGALRGRA